MPANASYFSDGSSGLKLIKPEFSTPVEAVIIHAFVLMVPKLVSIFRYEPDQFISFTIVFELTEYFFYIVLKGSISLSNKSISFTIIFII